jgi:hypothetical protein
MPGAEIVHLNANEVGLDPRTYDFSQWVPAGVLQPNLIRIDGLGELTAAFEAVDVDNSPAPIPELMNSYAGLEWIDDLDVVVTDRRYWAGPVPAEQWVESTTRFSLSFREDGEFSATEYSGFLDEQGRAEPYVVRIANTTSALFMRAQEADTCQVFPQRNGAANQVLADRLPHIAEALKWANGFAGLNGRACYDHQVIAGDMPGRVTIIQTFRSGIGPGGEANLLSAALFGGRHEYEVDVQGSPRLLSATWYPSIGKLSARRYEFSDEREIAPGILRPMQVQVTESLLNGQIIRWTEFRYQGAVRAGQSPRELLIPASPENLWAVHTR